MKRREHLETFATLTETRTEQHFIGPMMFLRGPCRLKIPSVAARKQCQFSSRNLSGPFLSRQRQILFTHNLINITAGNEEHEGAIASWGEVDFTPMQRNMETQCEIAQSG